MISNQNRPVIRLETLPSKTEPNSEPSSSTGKSRDTILDEMNSKDVHSTKGISAISLVQPFDYFVNYYNKNQENHNYRVPGYSPAGEPKGYLDKAQRAIAMLAGQHIADGDAVNLAILKKHVLGNTFPPKYGFSDEQFSSIFEAKRQAPSLSQTAEEIFTEYQEIRAVKDPIYQNEGLEGLSNRMKEMNPRIRGELYSLIRQGYALNKQHGLPESNQEALEWMQKQIADPVSLFEFAYIGLRRASDSQAQQDILSHIGNLPEEKRKELYNLTTWAIHYNSGKIDAFGAGILHGMARELGGI